MVACAHHTPLAAQSAVQRRDAARVAQAAGIAYVHMEALGGLHHARPYSVNTGWRNLSVRGFADYTTAIMCSEALPWRCHRSLIADALSVRGIPVEHIMTAASRKPHALTPLAHLDSDEDSDKITYTLP